MKIFFIWIFLLGAGGVAAQSMPGSTPCPTIDSKYFAGSAEEQARCLLRTVKIHGELGSIRAKLPKALDQLVGQRVTISAGDLRRYLTKQKIAESDLGGSLAEPLASLGDQKKSSSTKYFVIHDVSTPNYLDAAFPPDINEASWVFNDLQKRWSKSQVAHVFVSRTGQSITAVDFGSPLPQGRFGTKFARDYLRESEKALQIHIELVQPRRRDPAGAPDNDAIAPQPGFTEAQLDRLALLYVAASIRRGEWLIPAFHAAVDAGIPNAHDDPQNFDLDLWDRKLGQLLKALKQK